MEVPTIDCSILREDNPDVTALGAVAKRIGGASRTTGFFQITKHTLDPDLAYKALDYTRRFFRLPLKDKMELRGGIAAGYQPAGFEEVETYHLRHDGDPGIPKINIGPNVYPSHPSLPPDFKPVMLEYLARMDDLSKKVMMLIALSLDLPHTEEISTFPQIAPILAAFPSHSSAFLQCYTDLKLVKRWQIIEPLSTDCLDRPFIRGRQNDQSPTSLVIPFLSTERWNVLTLSTTFSGTRDVPGGPFDSLILALVSPDSTTTYYRVHSGIKSTIS
ncbi:Clavaminate synthase-like protein [Gonapodya prolifera JEL478]|uniref:Clavaminate synthase-like protein n=1 Tax=Gonapodya prolifera (strain JEL478) TaxID=1344416 RepID=A0A139AMQ3_GONPJ|nr:Clavaminate synthase-like protein [Gonapodya prolifera JEL478]|eukprot:KXS18047.1 Clavaminate synthase-like protein [Gonapodya prolifera JEL478]